MASFRSVPGVRRGAEIGFSFDGHALTGHQGDSIAAALLAAGLPGQRVSPRDGDSRGYYCGMGQCWECAVRVQGLGVVRACMEPLVAGMVLHPADKEI